MPKEFLLLDDFLSIATSNHTDGHGKRAFLHTQTINLAKERHILMVTILANGRSLEYKKCASTDKQSLIRGCTIHLFSLYKKSMQ